MFQKSLIGNNPKNVIRMKTMVLLFASLFWLAVPFTSVIKVNAESYFSTLPVGAVLPSEATCASQVDTATEIRPTNATYNQTKGAGGNYVYPGVTGNYTGTTDEIIQWAACKWGMDEDTLRAQAVTESSWFQNNYGDWTTNGNACTNLLPIGNYPAQYNGDSVHNGQCPESIGMMQVRWTYHKSAFYSSTTENSSTLTNNAVYSTAYNLDYYAALWRSCYNGEMTWLNTVERGADYTAGDIWGCLGVWYSGRWRTDPALNYISAVEYHLSNRTWETAEFATRTTANTIIQPDTPPIDTVNPSIAITSPITSQSVSGTVAISATATDNTGVASVSIYLDGSLTPLATDTTAPYSFSWNTTSVPNGSHTLIAKASDLTGNIGTSAQINFTVANSTGDTQAPTVNVTSPSSGSRVSGTVTIRANATDNVKVTKVEFLVDGVVKYTDTTSPYTYSWNTSSVTRGYHTITARAYDAAGNSKLSTAISVRK